MKARFGNLKPNCGEHLDTVSIRTVIHLDVPYSPVDLGFADTLRQVNGAEDADSLHPEIVSPVEDVCDGRVRRRAEGEEDILSFVFRNSRRFTLHQAMLALRRAKNYEVVRRGLAFYYGFDDNRTLLRRYIEEVWDKKNPSAVDLFLAPNYKRHRSPTAKPLTRDGQKELLSAFRTAFPDIELTVEEIIAKEDGIAFISCNRIKEGSFDEFRKHYRDSVPPIEAGMPDTLVQLAYVNEDATEVVIVRLFPSAEAMDLHLQGADGRSKAAYKFIKPASIDFYGTPNKYAMETMKKIAGSGIDVTIKSQFIGGFIRPKVG